MAHTISWNIEGIIRNFSDEISPDEILQSNFDIHNQPKFENVKYIINDFREVTSLNVDTAVTKIYASTDDIIARTKGKLLIAIIATHKEHLALAENYQKEMKNNLFKCEIFKNLEDAQKWIAT